MWVVFSLPASMPEPPALRQDDGKYPNFRAKIPR